jgi:predicted membrane protein
MYGAHLSDWSNVGKSVAQLFLLILGEFGSYFEIMQINPLLSAVFFWSYIIMALFLLFNMVLAVIFTVYEEKNTEIMALEAAEREEELKAKESKKDK